MGFGVATSFVEYFFQQGFHLELVFLLVPALVHLGVVAVVCATLGRRIEPQALRVTFTAALLVVLAAVVGIATFEAVASWYRPEGEGVSIRAPIYTRVRRAGLVAAAAAIAVAGFLTATLPLVEWLSSCHTGGPILTDRYVACG